MLKIGINNRNFFGLFQIYAKISYIYVRTYREPTVRFISIVRTKYRVIFYCIWRGQFIWFDIFSTLCNSLILLFLKLLYFQLYKNVSRYYWLNIDKCNNQITNVIQQFNAIFPLYVCVCAFFLLFILNKIESYYTVCSTHNVFIMRLIRRSEHTRSLASVRI